MATGMNAEVMLLRGRHAGCGGPADGLCKGIAR